MAKSRSTSTYKAPIKKKPSLQALTLAQAREYTQQHPQQAMGWKALGMHLLAEQPAAARDALKQAIQLTLNDHETLLLLTKAEHALGNEKQALVHIEQAEHLIPNDQETLTLKANTLHALYRYDEAITLFEKLIKRYPKEAYYWNNLGNVKRDIGLLTEADTYFQKSIHLYKKNGAIPYSNRLTTLHYRPDVTREQIFTACKEWESLFSKSIVSKRPEPADRSAQRRIRIGLFSDGFRKHPVGRMITPGLENINQQEIELYVYSTNHIEDEVTLRIKAKSAQWIAITHLSDHEFAQRLRDDDIDILIDLCGHNAGTRMQTMAMQPAPVLVKWVGGLINTTGLAAIDYLLSDTIESPPGDDAYYTEKLIRMPDDYICYAPPEYAPNVTALPALQNGYITLGCFNNPIKINSVLLAEWAKLMHALPDSRLFLKGHQYNSTTLRQQVRTTMLSHGISEDRLVIEGPSSHLKLLETYNQIDIALDPWPYSGGLTTCEAMLMGVPVVTMPGPTFAGRHSATHLVNAGMPELVVDSWDAYRDCVIGLASDLTSLATIRTHLRNILLQSPVCDGPRFAKHFTTAMRAVWQRYCEGKAPAALTINQESEAWFDGESLPMDIQRPAIEPDEKDFNFSFIGKIITVDNGAILAKNGLLNQLSSLGAFSTIIFDHASIINEIAVVEQLEDVHHFPHTVLGDGQPATLYTCLSPTNSATLQPLQEPQLAAEDQAAAQVLATLPIVTHRLDAIEGLESIDWLLLDNLNDSLTILEHGKETLANTLLIQARINFVPTHDKQPELAVISGWLSQYGFSFYRFNNLQHYSHLPKRDGIAAPQGTQLTVADALFIPNKQRLAELTDNQRLKLAFVLHSVYGVQDLTYELIRDISVENAKNYLQKKGQHSTVDPLMLNHLASSPSPQETNRVIATPTTASGSISPASAEATPTMYTTEYSNVVLNEKIYVVDIGANPIDGAPPYKKMLDENKISLVGFEPQKDALKKLNRQKSINETYLPLAVGDGGEATLYICKAEGMTSTLKPNNKILDHFQGYPIWGEVIKKEKLRTVRLDDINQINQMDWLKIDIQGGELTVFKNAEEKLKNTLVIQTEVNFIQLYEDQPLFAEIDQWMREHGFMLHTLLEQRKRLYAPFILNGQIHEGTNQLTTADAVYIKDINNLDSLTSTERKKMAVILQEAYGSIDLAHKITLKDISIPGYESKPTPEDSKGSFIHICFNNIHIQPLLPILKNIEATSEFTHKIFIEKSRSIENFDVDISCNPNAYLFDKHIHLESIVKLILNDDTEIIFFHGIFFDWQKYLIEKIGKNKKIIWIMWGGDLYNPIKERQLINGTVEKIYGVATGADGDYNLFCETYLHKPRIRFAYSSGFDLEKILIPKTKEKTIFLGNSGDESNCHIEILENLANKVDISDYNIIIPLAYNLTEHYEQRIKNCIDELGLSTKTTLLKKLIPAEDYLTMLAKAEFLITAHHRQQAMGNLTASLFFGNKTILRERIRSNNKEISNPAWGLLTEMDAQPISYEAFSACNFLRDIPFLDKISYTNQKSGIMERYGQDAINKTMREQFTEAARL